MKEGEINLRRVVIVGFFIICLGAGFFILVLPALAAAPAINYAPNLRFSSGEKYFPADPLEFYYENGQEISGEIAVLKYNNLTIQEKLNKLTVLYHIEDEGDELVYEYWFFSVFNDAAGLIKNKHYGDWESVFVFVDKSANKVNKVIGTAHERVIFDTEIYAPSSNHIWAYIGEGSHANCVDEENDGYCNFTKWRRGEKWDGNGPQVLYNQYNLKEITLEYVTQFNGATILTDVPILGINFLEGVDGNITNLVDYLFSEEFYKKDWGGGPPPHAWAQSNYYEPEELRPYSVQMAKEYVLDKANQAKETAVGWLNNLGALFSGSKQSAGISAALFTPMEELIEQANLFFTGAEPAETTKSLQLPETKPAPLILPSSAEAKPAAKEPIKEEIKIAPKEAGKETPKETEGKPAEKKIYYGDGGNSAGNNNGGASVSVENGETVLEEAATTTNEIILDEDAAETATSTDEIATTTEEIILDDDLGETATSTDETATSTEEIDLTPPPTISNLVAEYGDSRGTINLSWTAPADAVEYIIRYATSSIASSTWDLAIDVSGEPTPGAVGETENFTINGLDIGQTYYFALKSTDESGNISEMSNIASSSPSALAESVVISEVQLYDREFVELYNPTGQEVDLSGWYWSYFSSDRDWNEPYRNKKFPAGAAIAAGGYYLIGLNGFGANNGFIEVDWPAYSSSQLGNYDGSVAIFSSDPSSASSSAEAEGLAIDALGWGNAQYVFKGGPAVPPEQYRSLVRRTAGWDTGDNNADFIAKDWPNPTNSWGDSATIVSDKIEITQDSVWDLAGSPYLLESNSGDYPTIETGAVLTVEPGVIVKGANKYYPSLLVKGVLKAEGTSDSPIIFTANTSTPASGDWSGIVFDGAEAGSVLNYVRFESGGYESFYKPKIINEMLRIIDSDVTVSNSIFEKSAKGAIYLENSNSLIFKTTFSQNGSTAIVVFGSLSAPTIENCRFEDNGGNGIDVLSGAAPVIANNVFSDNFYPLTIRSSYPELGGNEASGNNLNGIAVEQDSFFEKDAIWKADSLAYILFSGSGQAPTVATGTVLTIEPGTVIKPYSPYYTALKIEGELVAEGAIGTPIVFTSLKDDDYAGDTNNSTSTPADGDWKDIKFAAGSRGRLSQIIFRYGSDNVLDIDVLADVILKE